VAELQIHAVSECQEKAHSWSQELSRGFVIDYKVASTNAPIGGAEIAVHLEPSGYWFGGGHFIRQMWPLNDAALEVGPWYAFDNGPNGVNNLLGPHWMTSGGLLVSVDPDTPFLHVGMNAPMDDKRSWVPRKWGVGIQNAARELLPLTQAHGRVARAGCDGLLRVQARASYQDKGMVHPLKEWRPDVGEAVHAQHDMVSIRVALCATANAAEACKMALNTLSPPKMVSISLTILNIVEFYRARCVPTSFITKYIIILLLRMLRRPLQLKFFALLFGQPGLATRAVSTKQRLSVMPEKSWNVTSNAR